MAISVLLVCFKTKSGIVSGKFNIMEYIIPSCIIGIALLLINKEGDRNGK